MVVEAAAVGLGLCVRALTSKWVTARSLDYRWEQVLAVSSHGEVARAKSIWSRDDAHVFEVAKLPLSIGELCSHPISPIPDSDFCHKTSSFRDAIVNIEDEKFRAWVYVLET